MAGLNDGSSNGARAGTAEDAPLYERFAGIYDAIFEPIFERRLRGAVKLLKLASGDRVLDLGIGTGLSLCHYPKGVKVVGVDLAGGMLAEANGKARTMGGPDVQLAQMDALDLGFADRSFDAVLVSFVVSVVSDPARCIREVERVAKPGARIVILNHFRSDSAVVSRLEDLANPVCVRLGWRANLRLEDVMAGARMKVRRVIKRNFLDFWSAVVAEMPNGSNSLQQ